MKFNINRYFIKYKIKILFKRKYKTKIYLLKKYKENEKFFIRKKNLYHLSFFKNKFPVHLGLYFNAYQKTFLWIKNKYFNFKYYNTIIKLKDKDVRLKNKKKDAFLKSSKNRIRIFAKSFYIYNYFFRSIFIDIFYFNKFVKVKKKTLLFYLILSFKKNKFFLNLKNAKFKNYISLSTGLFIKFFEKKKSFKKNKTIKLLMAKFIRKIFLISNIKNTVMIIKRNPIFLMEIINFFNSPISHKFINPFSDKLIEESENNFIWIKFLYFIFIENKNFTKNKIAQKGRIKRKILRKVILENKIID